MASSLNTSNLSMHNQTLGQTNEEPSLLYAVSILTVLSLIATTTVIGNFLVIISVLTTKALHTVTNTFIMSLAVADTLVAILVMPLSIYMFIYNNWKFGNLICDLWISSDVMLCTASILNLCCISLDRYFAITRPLSYSRQRSPKLARTMIAFVWIGSVLISCPPVFGWKDKNREENTCSLNVILSYRIYSSMGSFYVPCLIMIFVYLRIFKVIHDRDKYLTSATNGQTYSFSEKSKSEPEERRFLFKSNKNVRKNYSNFKLCCCCCCFKSNTGNDLAKMNKQNFDKTKQLTIQEKNSAQESGVRKKEDEDDVLNMLTITNDEYIDDDLIKNYPSFLSETIENLSEKEKETRGSRELGSSANAKSDGLMKETKSLRLKKIDSLSNHSSKSFIKNDSNSIEALEKQIVNNSNFKCLGSLFVSNSSSSSNRANQATLLSTHSFKRGKRANSLLSTSASSSYSGQSLGSLSQKNIKTSSFTIKPNTLDNKNKSQIIKNNKKQKLPNIIITLSSNASSTIRNSKIYFDNNNNNNSTNNSISFNFRSNRNSILANKKMSRINKTQPNSFVARKLATSTSNLNMSLNEPNKNTLYVSSMGDSSNKSESRFDTNMCSIGENSNHRTRSSAVRVSMSSFGSQAGALASRKTRTSDSKRNQEQMRLIKESKAAKTLAIVVGGFIVSWLPFFIMYVLEPILPHGTISKTTVDLITWLGYLNSSINPIIYAFCSKQFRMAFYRITFGKFSSSTAEKYKKNQFYYLSNINCNLNSNVNYSTNNLNRKKCSASFKI